MPSPIRKAIKRILPAPRPHWVGNGFNVYPVFASLAFTEALSPWLMFDYAAPKEFPPTNKRLGVGQHPHRGFETVTIAFQGGVEHQDSVGNNDVIGPGDVQWMTAGRGIIHEEYHSTSFAKNGGTFEMCQLWVNLPAKDKMHAPRYQPILDKDIPVVPLRSESGEACDADGAKARIIAGSIGDTSGPAMTFTPIELFDLSLPNKDQPVELDLPEGHTAILFVRKGSVAVGGGSNGKTGEKEEAAQTVGPQGVAVMEREGTTLRLAAMEAGTQLLLLGGEPIDEPIAARGPFVMNTQQEIMQANMDFQNGKMGR